MQNSRPSHSTHESGRHGLGDRKVEVDGCFNFRDAGGLPLVSGNIAAPRMLYRSDNLGDLSAEGVRTVEHLGVRVVVDLRFPHERAASPSPFRDHPTIRLVEVDLGIDPNDHQSSVADPADEYPVVKIVRAYWQVMTDRQEQLLEILRAVAEPGNTPMVVHCMGGKDRTGIAAAMIQSLIGVPSDLIALDYALTARNMAPPASEDPDVYERNVCPPEAMHIILMMVEACFGSVEEYVATIGLTDQQLRRIRELLTDRGDGQ